LPRSDATCTVSDAEGVPRQARIGSAQLVPFVFQPAVDGQEIAVSNPSRFVMISARGCLRGTDPRNALDDDTQFKYVHDLSTSLVALGHEVEIWTVQCDDQPQTVKTQDGVLIRRFPGQRDYLVPRVRPCGWVAEWVACASAHLVKAPGVVATLVTHGWEAGVAGRSLADRFGFAQIHVPHALEDQGNDQSPSSLTWQVDEDRQSCRAASAVVATTAIQRDVLVDEQYAAPADRVVIVLPGPDIGRRFIAALPRVRDRAAPVALASIGVMSSADIESARGRHPRYISTAVAS
jgi:hypothetical protein